MKNINSKIKKNRKLEEEVVGLRRKCIELKDLNNYEKRITKTLKVTQQRSEQLLHNAIAKLSKNVYRAKHNKRDRN